LGWSTHKVQNKDGDKRTWGGGKKIKGGRKRRAEDLGFKKGGEEGKKKKISARESRNFEEKSGVGTRGLGDPKTGNQKQTKSETRGGKNKNT